MRRIAIFFLLALSVLTVSAESVKGGLIIGKVLDAGSKQPLEFANISLRKANGNKEFIKGAVADQTGLFRLDALTNGNFIISITVVGYTPFEKEISIGSNQKNINLKNVLLKEDTHLLSEVQVVGQRSQMKFEIDRKVFNVDQNLATTGGSASDVLSNIPSVQVDPEGEVSLRGNASVTVWINGKESGLSAENRAQVLEQLPAESIERVEIITNPSAKYNPEGTAGIINIVLKKNRKAGYYGSVQAGVDTKGGYNAGANVNYSSGKFETFLNIGKRFRKRDGEGYTNRTNLNEDGSSSSYLNQLRSNEDAGGPYMARTGGTYHLTDKDHLGLNLFGLLGSGDETDRLIYEGNIPLSFTKSQRISKANRNIHVGNIELNYKRDFSEKSNLDVSASYNIFAFNPKSNYSQNSIFADGSESSSYQFQNNDMNRTQWEFQADYVNEFGNQNKIEAGYKGDFTKMKSPVETYGGISEASAVFNEDLYNRFTYDQDVQALYTTYSKKINKFGLQLGLRGEYTRTTTNSLGYGQTNAQQPSYKDNYFSLYPSMFLSYQLPDNNEVQLNYSRRVSRPWGRQLNPFMDLTDSTSISYGNPYLVPEYSNSLELNYIKNWESHTLSASLYYRSTDNVIQHISYRDGDIMKRTYDNVAKSQSAGTELILKDNLFRFLDLTTTLNFYYNKLDGFTYLPEGVTTSIVGNADENFSWSGRMIANVMLPYAVSLQATGNYDSRQIVAQGYTKPSHSIDLGLRKSFLDRKLSLTINTRDILNSRKRITVTSGSGFSQESMFARSGRVVGFTLTYNFGNMNAGKKGMKQDKQQQGAEDNSMEEGF
ncbi:TonB-dependent receptor domain-containing protein [Bacteroides ihuae]|uniref:TonB-dependent receptor domain-containing protein n=1 Tax=Bacteroides ihuae TaxID=1852362 RepID=UPI0008DA7E91|nr:outer membrane beta-barrel family protein [Bacteroides ihuae]